jgi:hypothetical protein
MLFKRFLVEKILVGEKTQTRRTTERKRGAKIYDVGDRVGIQTSYGSAIAHIIIKNRRRQMIGEITEEDARKEGFSGVREFKQAWLKLYGSWDPNQEVWVYDFVLDMQDLPSRDSNAGQEVGQSESH